MDTIQTKICKACNEVKPLSGYKPKAATCRICTNNTEREKYYKKQGILEIPKKRNKYTTREEKYQAVLLYNRTRDKHNSQNITDEYVKDILRTQAYHKGVKPDLSIETIHKKRQDIEQSRSTTKQCAKCKKDLEKSFFYKGVKNFCKKCYCQKSYAKYGRPPYNPANKERDKKRYALNKELLTDGYIKSLIRTGLKNYKFHIRVNDISDEHVKLKRKEVILKKQINHGKNNTNSSKEENTC